MLPLSLLRTAIGHPMLVELKNGDTYNGRLVSCDSWMNINLREVICTSRDGDRFWRMPECYMRGNAIKYLRIPDEVIDMVDEDEQLKSDRGAKGARGGRGGRIGGRGGGGKGGGYGVGQSSGGARGGKGGDGRGRGGARGGGGRGDSRGGKGGKGGRSS